MEAVISHQQVLIKRVDEQIGPVIDSYVKYVTIKPMLGAVLDGIPVHLDLSIIYSHIKQNSSKEFQKSVTDQSLDLEVIYSMMFCEHKKRHKKANEQFRLAPNIRLSFGKEFEKPKKFFKPPPTPNCFNTKVSKGGKVPPNTQGMGKKTRRKKNRDKKAQQARSAHQSDDHASAHGRSRSRRSSASLSHGGFTTDSDQSRS